MRTATINDEFDMNNQLTTNNRHNNKGLQGQGRGRGGIVKEFIRIVGFGQLSDDDAHALLKQNCYNLQGAVNAFYESLTEITKQNEGFDEGKSNRLGDRNEELSNRGSEAAPLHTVGNQITIAENEIKIRSNSTPILIDLVDNGKNTSHESKRSSESNVRFSSSEFKSFDICAVAKKRPRVPFAHDGISPSCSENISCNIVKNTSTNERESWPRKLCRFQTMIESTVNFDSDEVDEVLNRSTKLCIIAQDDSKKLRRIKTKKRGLEGPGSARSGGTASLPTVQKGSMIVRVSSVHESTTPGLKVCHRFFGRLKKNLATLTYHLMNTNRISLSAELQTDCSSAG